MRRIVLLLLLVCTVLGPWSRLSILVAVAVIYCVSPLHFHSGCWMSALDHPDTTLVVTVVWNMESDGNNSSLVNWIGTYFLFNKHTFLDPRNMCHWSNYCHQQALASQQAGTAHLFARPIHDDCRDHSSAPVWLVFANINCDWTAFGGKRNWDQNRRKKQHQNQWFMFYRPTKKEQMNPFSTQRIFFLVWLHSNVLLCNPRDHDHHPSLTDQ